MVAVAAALLTAHVNATTSTLALLAKSAACRPVAQGMESAHRETAVCASTTPSLEATGTARRVQRVLTVGLGAPARCSAQHRPMASRATVMAFATLPLLCVGVCRHSSLGSGLELRATNAKTGTLAALAHIHAPAMSVSLAAATVSALISSMEPVSAPANSQMLPHPQSACGLVLPVQSVLLATQGLDVTSVANETH